MSNKLISSNLERLKSIKKKAEELGTEYHDNIQKLKFMDKDIEFMIKKTNTLDSKLDKLLVNYK